MNIKPNPTKALLLIASIMVSNVVSATHEGVWHGGGAPLSVSFCLSAGTVLGSGVEAICLEMFE